MAKITLTLRNRISTLMVISSLVFISVFTLIQLNSQLANINRYNSYQANLASAIVKSTIDAIIKQANPAEKDLSLYIQNSITKLRQANIINDALVFDKNGTVIAATQKDLINTPVRYRDLGKMQELEQLAQENTWLLPEIDTITNRLYIYLAFKASPQEPIMYCVKIIFSLGNIQEALLVVYKPVILTTVIIIFLNIMLAYFLSKSVIGPLKLLNEVTKMIAAGNLSIRTRITTADELQELGETFNHMTEELIKMKERAENANPLTKLPGNIVIQEKINRCLTENVKFLVIYCDLDNFKAFNDKYGIAKGDEAIKLTAHILKDALKNKGNEEDFIGHEGGDDFILLTSPEKGKEITDYIIGEFNKSIRAFYAKEDLEAGGIIAHSRDGTVKKFPVMTISMAGVTNNHRVISSYGEVTNIAAEVKKKAKSMESSIFILDKRTGSLGLGPEGRQGAAQDQSNPL